MFTFYKAIPEHGRRRWQHQVRGRRPPPSQFTHRSRHSMFSYFYVLCRVRVRFCWFELSFVGGGFRLIHLLSGVEWSVAVLPRARCVCVGVSALSAAPLPQPPTSPPPPPCRLTNTNLYRWPARADRWPARSRVLVNYTLMCARSILHRGHHANTTFYILFTDTVVLMIYV